MPNLFKRIFAKSAPPKGSPTRAEIIGGDLNVFTPWSGDAYANDIYRGGVDAIARNAAKLKGSHIIRHSENEKSSGSSKMNRLLQIQPNPYMSAFDMLYKLVTHYFLYNNAFAFLQRDSRGMLSGIYPIKAQHMEFLVDATGAMFCKFLFAGGKFAVLPYADIIHLRRNFNDNDLFGDSNDALQPALELAHTQNEGIIKGIKNGANIRGILHYSQIMPPEQLREARDNFMNDYLTMNNEGGVITTDSTMEYQPLTVTSSAVDEKQTAAVKMKIFNYLGISEKIVNSSYNEDEWAAFYESVLEPIALALSLEFTRKIFNDREQSFGNSVLFESGRLQFTSNATKVKLISELMPYGLLTINQALEMLNLPSVPDGDKRLQTLNVVDAQKANEYQLAREAKTTEDK